MNIGGKRIEVTESSSHNTPGQIGWILAEHGKDTAKVEVDSDDAHSVATRYTRLSSRIYSAFGIKVTAKHIEAVMTEMATTLGTD